MPGWGIWIVVLGGLRVLGWEGIPVRIVVLGCGSPGRV